MWPACIGTTSQSTSSLYLPIEKETSTYLFTLTFPQSFNHCNLYGLGCFKVGKFNFLTKVVHISTTPFINDHTTYLVVDVASSMKNFLPLLFHVFLFDLGI